MARISTYQIDENISGGDKWIGTDSSFKNATKNFTADKVADYLNSSGVIQSQSLRYMYQSSNNPRYNNTISFIPSGAIAVPFASINTFLLSKYAKPNKDVHTFYSNPLIGSTILLTSAENVSNWAIYSWNSSTEDPVELSFYNIGLTFRSGVGGLVEGEDYLISLLGVNTSSDKTFIYPQSAPSDTWMVTHNLNKYPSVSIVDSADTVVYGDVNYINENELIITFTSEFSGKAFLN